ncbi:MAG: hypothetical protein H6707_16235 [Deltaproteobacteria bacterium]|nr:hypothetical protein [Deltaproteobacteria bacterium]
MLTSKLARISFTYLLLLSACATDNPGIAPDRDSFYFPTGLALDPARPVLYLTNSNADLRYNGGMISALDLRALPFNISQMLNGGAGALECAPEPTDPSVLECPEGQFIIEGATLRVGDFPAELRVDATGKRLFAPIRGENHLLWAEIVDLANGSLDLRCSSDPDSGCGSSGDADCAVFDCDGSHQVDYSQRLQTSLPSEPFGIELNALTAVHVDAEGRRQTCRDGNSQVSCVCSPTEPRCDRFAIVPRSCCIESPGVDHLYLAHLVNGQVSLFVLSDSDVELADISGSFFGANRGAVGLAARVPGDAGSPVYVGSKRAASIGAFVVQDHQRIIATSGVTIDALSPGDDVRGIAVSAGGQRLYALDRIPPALVAIDLDGTEGRAAGETIWVTEVCDEPSLLSLAPDPRQPGAGPDRLAYVVCFRDDQIYVLDTVTGALIDRISTGAGPNALVFERSSGAACDASNPCASAREQCRSSRCHAPARAYVANFADNTVGVIDLDPQSGWFGRMVMRIGVTSQLAQGSQ